LLAQVACFAHTKAIHREAKRKLLVNFIYFATLLLLTSAKEQKKSGVVKNLNNYLLLLAQKLCLRKLFI